MAKTKLAICFGDKEYQRRFVKCFMHHYESHYEVHVFGNVMDLKQSKDGEVQVLLLEGVVEQELRDMEKPFLNIFCLTETGSPLVEEKNEQFVYLPKYQEIYKLEQQIKEILLEHSSGVGPSGKLRKRRKWIGVYSLNHEEYQIPFSGMVATEYGETYETLLLNLQPLSGLGVSQRESDVEVLSLEDLLTAVAAENYTIKRWMGGIGHELNWDYVYPVKNAICLAEASSQMYEKLVDVVCEELGYECIILNFGAMFSDVFALMEKCEVLYFLVSDKESLGWREQEFAKELSRQGKEELLSKIVRIKIVETYQSNGDWRMVAQTLRWSGTGDQFRKYKQMENVNG